MAITSVSALVKFGTHEIFPKFCLKFEQNFSQYFASFLSYFPFPPPQKISGEITYTMLSDIFIFVRILKFQFAKILAQFWKDEIFAKLFPEILTKFSVPHQRHH